MPTVAEESIDAFQNYYARPPERPKKRSFRQMLYDPETKSYFGRSVESWGKLYIKYIYIYIEIKGRFNIYVYMHINNNKNFFLNSIQFRDKKKKKRIKYDFRC